VSEQVWVDFIRHRKVKRSPVTETALSRIEAQAVKAGWQLDDALSEICSRGWTGFKAEWVEKESNDGLSPAGRRTKAAAERVFGAAQ